MLQRKHDWESELAQYLRARVAAPFEWGKYDCALFACDAAQVATGVDLAQEFRGRYSTERGAAKVIRAFCGGGLEQLAEKIAAQFEIPEVQVLFARRGDIVIVATPTGPGLGVVDLDGMHAIAVGLAGAVQIPLAECLRAWRIG